MVSSKELLQDSLTVALVKLRGQQDMKGEELHWL